MQRGGHLAMTRWDSRAPRGARVTGRVPHKDGQHVTRLGTLGIQGLQAVMTVEGATGADVFRTAVNRARGPTWTPGDIVVMDHLRAHHAIGGHQAMARRGARLEDVPPYSPELSPIEPCWAKVTTALRQANARARDTLDTAITRPLTMVTADDAHRWFDIAAMPSDSLKTAIVVESGTPVLSKSPYHTNRT
jgi:hypothetical protein